MACSNNDATGKLSGQLAMHVFSSLTRLLEIVLLWVLAVFFGALCVTIFYQVLDRNVLGGGGLWTFEFAQLMLSWCVFVGAAIAVRRGAHYFVEMFPQSFVTTNHCLKLCSDLATTIVAAIMMVYGIDFLDVGSGTDQNTLPFTLFWNYLPIPISGGLMLIFLVETWITDVTALRQHARPSEPVLP